MSVGKLGGLPEVRGTVLDTYTTAIDDATTITSSTFDVVGYPSVIIAVKTDTETTVRVDFSPDGTNWDSTLTYIAASGTNEVHRLTVTRRYVRYRLTNASGANQTYMRAQFLAGDYPQLSAPANLQLQQDADAIAVRPSQYATEVALGKYENHTLWNKFGYNADIDTSTDPEVIWPLGGTSVTRMSAGTLNVVSSSTDDDGSPAGIGAQFLLIMGLDENYETQSEIITMNGTTTVTTSGSWTGVNRAVVYTAGNTGANVGDITITATTGGSNQAYITAGEGVTQQAFFFVQANHTALIRYVSLNVNKISGGGTPVVTIKCWVTSLVSGGRYLVFREVIDTSVVNDRDLPLHDTPFPVTEKSLIEWRAETTVNNTVVNMRFSLIEVKTA